MRNIIRRKNAPKEEKKEDALVRATKWLVYSTIALAVFTLTLSILTYLLYRDATHQTKIIEENTINSQENAVKSDKLSRKAIEIADSTLANSKNAFNTENRAYLFIQNFGVANRPIYYEKFQIQASAINTGKTPAKNITTQTKIEFKTSPKYIPPSRDFDTIEYYPVLTQSTPLGLVYFSPTLSGEQYELYMNNGLYIYFYGIITYTDIFETKHYLTFGGYFDRRAGAFKFIKGWNDFN